MTDLRITDLFDLTVQPATVPIPAAALDFAAVRVKNYSMGQTPFGPTFVANLVLDHEIGFQSPGLPLSFLLAGSPAAPLRVRAVLSEDWFVELYGLGIVARFDPLVLRSLDPAQQFAEIRADSGIRVSPGELTLLDSDLNLSLPPSEIPNTGIIIALNGLVFDFFTDSTPEEIEALGYGPEFQGIYAREAQLSFLTQLVFGQALGLTLTAEQIAISVNGVTCKIDADFLLDVSETEILAESTIRGELFGAEWPFALGSVTAEVYDNVPLSFTAEGAVRVPLLDQVFGLSFGMERGTTNSKYHFTASIHSEGESHIRTPFGAIDFESFRLSGLVEEEGFSLSGDMDGLQIDLAPLDLTVASIRIHLAHTPADDELRLDLENVSLSPLGTLETATLVISDHRDQAGTSRQVYLEAEMSWADLSSRLAIPDQFPAPPDDGRVQVIISWGSRPRWQRPKSSYPSPLSYTT